MQCSELVSVESTRLVTHVKYVQKSWAVQEDMCMEYISVVAVASLCCLALLNPFVCQEGKAAMHRPAELLEGGVRSV